MAHTPQDIIKAISDGITVLEAVRDHDGKNYTENDAENLAVLNFCYDLLTRTEDVSNMVVKTPEEMKEPGHENEYTQQYGQVSDAFVDFVFAIATGKGKVNLRKVLRHFVPSYRSVSSKTGIRTATISDYLTHKSSMTCDFFEKILNSRQIFTKNHFD